MTLRAWLDHNAAASKPSPFDHPSIDSDIVEIDPDMFPETGLHVIEGKDAEDSIRRQLTSDERERLGVVL